MSSDEELYNLSLTNEYTESSSFLSKNNDLIIEELLKKVKELTEKNDNLNQQIQDLLDDYYKLKKAAFRIKKFFIPTVSYFLALIGFIIFINLNSICIQCIII
ncbi:43776_t:CDS:1 [Gigaspora margarita]|uniref:43776_t:CDS:1 n=1 Tax=Gigaspora margarita TaxID=4874 RepID=A0ABN7VFC0_GIGMA|nr:43776_t:CDS:1 [Gigaspora margarita]